MTDQRSDTQLVTACVAGDRDALAGLIAALPERYPLKGVFHAAGVLDDGLIASLTPERLNAVLRAKVENMVEAAADAVALLLATARTHGATLVIATHDARVAALIPGGVEGQIGFQPLRLLRQPLLKEEQAA